MIIARAESIHGADVHACLVGARFDSHMIRLTMIILDSYMIVHDSYMIILRSYLDHVHVILYHAHESRMIAARARVPSTCMIWQVVPSTGIGKSINLDLVRAARYRYFIEN